MNKQQEKLLENFIRKEVRKSLKESNPLRSGDLWNILINVIESHKNRGSSLEMQYSGEQIFNALENLLKLMRVPVRKTN